MQPVLEMVHRSRSDPAGRGGCMRLPAQVAVLRATRLLGESAAVTVPQCPPCLMSLPRLARSDSKNCGCEP